MEAGKRKFQFEEKDLNKIVEQMFSNYKFHLKNKNFKFNFSPGENLPNIKIDEEAVSEAIINLIDNAVKYSNDKKEINIKTGTDYSFAYVEVSDKGIGISSEDQKKIFDKFFQGKNTIQQSIKGTGLGLSISYGIIRDHGGQIDIAETGKQGTALRITLPISKIDTNEEGSNELVPIKPA